MYSRPLARASENLWTAAQAQKRAEIFSHFRELTRPDRTEGPPEGGHWSGTNNNKVAEHLESSGARGTTTLATARQQLA